MSPRNKRLRKVLSPPLVQGFRPFGMDHGREEGPLVYLHYEEYESIRLCDYDGYTHHQASRIMDVSRPTFTRIYASARQKVAHALVEGSPISIEGGKVYFDSDWYHCDDCRCYFNNPDRDKDCIYCALCGSVHVSNYILRMDSEERQEEVTTGDCCVCLACGYEKPHVLGKPCSHEICPSCGTGMRRKERRPKYGKKDKAL